MVLIDQICWGEIDGIDWFRPQVKDRFWREIEMELRRKLYCWKHLPVDMVFNPYICIPKPIHNTGWGIEVHENTTKLDSRNGAAAHYYQNTRNHLK